jgi:hypothetical protein
MDEPSVYQSFGLASYLCTKTPPLGRARSHLPLLHPDHLKSPNPSRLRSATEPPVSGFGNRRKIRKENGSGMELEATPTTLPTLLTAPPKLSFPSSSVPISTALPLRVKRTPCCSGAPVIGSIKPVNAFESTSPLSEIQIGPPPPGNPSQAEGNKDDKE